jgi:hypothetical protein
LDLITNLTVSRSIFENQTSDQYYSILNEFVNLDIKIIIGIFDTNTTVKLFCEIFKLHMYGKNYQWIIVGSYNNELYNLNYYANSTDCTMEQIFIALNGSLQTRVVEYSHEYKDNLQYPNTKKTKVKNDLKTSNVFDSNYPHIVKSYLGLINQALKSEHHLNANKNNNAYFHGYAFDVLLTIFKILSTLIEEKKFSCQNSEFERNIQWFSHLAKAFDKVSFKGVTVCLKRH